MSFGAFVNGLMGGYQAGQNMQDQVQKRKLREFEVEREEEAARLRKTKRDVDKEAAVAVEMAKQGLAGDGMGPSEHLAGPTPETGPVTAEVTPAAIAQEGVAPAQPAVGLPAGQVGPGEMRPSAIEAAGATQANPPPAAEGTMPTARMPETVIRPKPEKTPVKKTESYHEARMRIAQERGNGELLSQYTKEYATHLSDEATIATKKFEKEQRPMLEAMARIKTEAEWKALPEETRAKMLKAQADAAEQSARNGATGWQLIQNPITRPDGMKLIGHAFGMDGPAKDIQRDGDFFIPIAPDGKPATDYSGKPIRVHKDAVERMVSQYGSKAPGFILREGEQYRSADGKTVIAENPKDVRPPPDQALQQVRISHGIIDQRAGVDSQTGQMINSSPEKLARLSAAKVKASEYVRAGMNESTAAERAWKETEPGAAPGKPGAAPAKPVDTSKYKF